MEWWREHVIKPIHSTRIKLPVILGVPGHIYMQFIYPIPVLVGGYAIMQWAIAQAEKKNPPPRRGDVSAQNAALQRQLSEIRDK